MGNKYSHLPEEVQKAANAIKVSELKVSKKMAVISLDLNWRERLVIPAELLPEFNKIIEQAEILDQGDFPHIREFKRDESPKISYITLDNYHKHKMAKLLGVPVSDLEPPEKEKTSVFS